MKKQITPCLWFDNQAKEAAALYCSVFKKSKITTQSPIVTEMDVSGQRLILLDGGPMYHPNPSISFYYICENVEEMEHIWEAFSKDGSIMMPLDTYPWSEKYGWVTDKFGISWQLALGKFKDVGQKITPYLLFTGKQYGRVDEAIDLYSSIFDNVKVDKMLRYGAGELPDKEGKVKHAQIDVDGQKLMLMESAAKHDFTFTEGVSLTLYCETQDEIDYYWEKLTENGEESMCGWLKDKFGVSWQIIPTILGEIMSNPAKAGKAAQAFMSMRKLNIEQIVQSSMS
ncbi:putative 3-demethylubiquinone-9 3-methyltransferase (glyoxalase superfamily) [Dinghuibacter silviterrae]|uniref:Putative 3-demethylubiquinone-9 3-methyltransferase (Glyoxalase superfamily) n=2 Tax=Dinghuibacter silviterrae TaxID=1539049 RepID=A0A4R8DJM5_9BACT|nr:putative 3-demethylubiquinone-9 3-methyltransferase (glyoxalase superfamily) [Dinghuibacter silviterrae]